MSRTRSASAWVARLSAAAPKSVTVLRCPVRPKGRFSIIACSSPMYACATSSHAGRLPETRGQGQERLTPIQGLLVCVAPLPWAREERQACGQLRCHEGITAADVGAEVLRRVTIHELPTKHGMGHAADFMLNGKQLAACLGMDNVLEAVLVVIAFLSDQTMLLQERVRTREVGDVHGEVVPIIFRNFCGRFAENETLLGTDLHPHRSGVHVLC